MRLEVVVSFVVVSRTGSVSGAARRLGYGQSTVTKHIQELEALVGSDLLERGARPLRLTPQGRDVAGRCAELLRAGMSFLRPREQELVRAGIREDVVPGVVAEPARMFVEIDIPNGDHRGSENSGDRAAEGVCLCLSKQPGSTAIS